LPDLHSANLRHDSLPFLLLDGAAQPVPCHTSRDYRIGFARRLLRTVKMLLDAALVDWTNPAAISWLSFRAILNTAKGSRRTRRGWIFYG
jgi:hypothetical protein